MVLDGFVAFIQVELYAISYQQTCQSAGGVKEIVLSLKWAVIEWPDVSSLWEGDAENESGGVISL